MAQCAWMGAPRSTTSRPALALAPTTGWFTWRYDVCDQSNVADPTFSGGMNRPNFICFSLWKGGGWCRNPDECAVRKGNFRGSSKFMRPLSFSGILGGSQKSNPGMSFAVCHLHHSSNLDQEKRMKRHLHLKKKEINVGI